MGFGFAGLWRRFYPFPRRAWHLRASDQHYAVFCDGFSFAERLERLLNLAHAPISHAKVPRAFVLGICMKIILGCGSGVRINAGSGNSHVLFVLLLFALGSFSGA